MSHRPAVQRFGVGCLVGLLAFGGGVARAQQGTLRGVIIDSSGAPIPGVEITISALGRITRTDSLGRMTFSTLPSGDVVLLTRRFGYRAQTTHLLIGGPAGDSIVVTLAAQPVGLSEVDVTAIGQHPFFAGFDQRRRLGVGTFITREEIESRNSSAPSDIFRQIPQVRLVRAGSGLGVRFPANMTSIRRGPNTDLCTPMIWLDGQRATGLEIDDLRSSDIQAIEMYRGASTTPPQFTAGGMVQCGAIVVWTRRKG